MSKITLTDEQKTLVSSKVREVKEQINNGYSEIDALFDLKGFLAELLGASPLLTRQELLDQLNGYKTVYHKSFFERGFISPRKPIYGVDYERIPVEDTRFTLNEVDILEFAEDLLEGIE